MGSTRETNLEEISAERRKALGAYHAEELNFLRDSFPSDWKHTRDDENLGQAIRTYWTQFAKTGNPNAPGFFGWPAYDARRDQYLDLGRTTRVRPVAPQLHSLEHIMNQIFSAASDQHPQLPPA